MSENNNDYILEVKNLKKYFPSRSAGKKVFVKAVDDVSFTIKRGETLGLVGETGCGKSTTGRSLLRLYEPTSGEVLFNGKNIFDFNKKEMKNARKQMQLIFQDPYSSLNPRLSVAELVGEALIAHKVFEKRDNAWRQYVEETVVMCGLQDFHINRYPHQFSGGQRQRIGIARALALKPEFIVCDEPVSALDVSIQSSVLNLMMDLQRDINLSYLFISHDLSVVKHISDRIGVMYLGSLVEFADKNDMFNNPKHPYTEALLSAIPTPDPSSIKKLKLIQGDMPSNTNPPLGCKFHTRCPYVKDICKEEIPEFKANNGDEHFVACHFPLA